MEEEVNARDSPCGKAIESRAHTVAESQLYKEERDVNEGGMKSFEVLDSSQIIITIYTRR